MKKNLGMFQDFRQNGNTRVYKVKKHKLKDLVKVLRIKNKPEGERTTEDLQEIEAIFRDVRARGKRI
jgi:hypothetical protein